MLDAFLHGVIFFSHSRVSMIQECYEFVIQRRVLGVARLTRQLDGLAVDSAFVGLGRSTRGLDRYRGPNENFVLGTTHQAANLMPTAATSLSNAVTTERYNLSS